MKKKMKKKKHRFQLKLQRKAKVITGSSEIIPFFCSFQAPIEEDDVENEDDSPNKKTKGKPGRKQQGQKNKTNPPDADNENGNLTRNFRKNNL